jgi:DNA-binding winged helix-turn-helix (wHTH) protein/tetratricopeptide (TPR) repeat protein
VEVPKVLLRFAEFAMFRHEQYEFGDFVLDVPERRLLRGGVPVHLPPKTHDVLVALVRDAGRLVTKAELLTRVWPETFVEEGILTVHVSNLRRALGTSPIYIETVARSGYRFVASVTRSTMMERSTSPRVPSRPLEACELVGRGRTHLLAASRVELPKAVECFQAAVALDPTYAAAYAGLALANCAQAQMRSAAPQPAYADAKAAALRALALDADSADAQVALGKVLFLSEWDWTGADRCFARALAISPSYTEAYLHYGSLLEALSHLDEGLRLKQQALERDPFSPLVHVQIATSYWNQRRYDDAIVWANRALELDPRHLLAREFLVGAHWKRGDLDQYVAESIRHAESYGCAGDQLAAVRRGCEAMRCAFDEGGARAVTRYMLEQTPRHPQAAIRLAILHAELGEFDAAFEYLDRALDDRDPALVHLAVAPQWDSLRSDPRLDERLTRMGLSPLTHAA